MSNNNYVSFIGAGNLAWHLAPSLDNAGYAVKEVCSTSLKSSKALVNRLYQAEEKEGYDFSDSPSQYFIIAVPDDIISEIAREIILPENAILLHTSGAKSIDLLSYAASEHIGVFYPLQTFSKQKKVDLSHVPICIEAEDTNTEKLLYVMGKAISKKVLHVNSNDRKALHVAAVFACNFVNHFMKISEDILSDCKLDFDMLHPLIAETINKSFELGPGQSQTGPAKRHDFETLDKHMEFLSGNETIAEIYRVVSQHIIDSYPKN
ncbi:DUF2520 domain-containing protein [Fulvivirga sp. 29W222]|uniref:DUF2520 domain-containing protein n=1 Tax=Fulvivirga marina TaxID=2494733 RepID=A0A937G365_9BACT|nr:Rossmann-like and DUF2520 domain-containing protein [Fulvivirga marina]MBL6449842.1 DUF2520 domain-containing protein [Fulvivirga marina]